jgi:iron complex outermembrane receptor protein
VPLNGLTLSLSYAFTDGRTAPSRQPVRRQPHGTLHIVYTPENASSFAMDYEHEVGMAILVAHLDWNLADGYYSSSSEPNSLTIPA